MSDTLRRASITDAGLLDTGEGRRLAPLMPRTLPEQVADRIVHAIGRGILKADERLIEADLANELAVSRAPVRDALRTLVTQGIVRAEPNRGVRVVRFDAAKTNEVKSARVALERLAARLVSRQVADDPGVLDPLTDAIATMRTCAEARDVPGMNRADIAFHDALYHASGSDTLVTLWRTIARQVEIIFAGEIARVPDPEMITLEHVQLCNAIRAGDDDALDAEVERHIAGARTLGTAETLPPARTTTRHSTNSTEGDKA